METSNNFALSCRKQFVENRHKLLIVGGGYIALCMIIGIWDGFFGWPEEVGAIVYLMMALLAFGIASSMLFSDLKTKQGRISFLMQPSSAAAKVMPRLIFLFIGMLVVAYLGYYILELFRLITNGILNGEWTSVSTLSSYLPKDQRGLLIFLFGGAYLLNCSTYAFGSALWPKYSYFKTTGALYVIQFLFILVFSWIMETDLIIQLFKHLNCLPKMNQLVVLYGLVGSLYVISAVFMYLTYFRIKKITLIN